MRWTYRLLDKDRGTLLASATVNCTQATCSLTFTPQHSGGMGDEFLVLTAQVVDEAGQTGANAAQVSLLIRRFAVPIIAVTAIVREETYATVRYAVRDTGYAWPQAANQLSSVSYKVGSGSWQNLSVALSGTLTLNLPRDASVTLALRCVNAAPVSDLAAKTSAEYTEQVLPYTPVFFAWKEEGGGSGVSVHALNVGADYSRSVDTGEIRARKIVLDEPIGAASLRLGSDLGTLAVDANSLLASVAAWGPSTLHKPPENYGVILTFGYNLEGAGNESVWIYQWAYPTSGAKCYWRRNINYGGFTEWQAG